MTAVDAQAAVVVAVVLQPMSVVEEVDVITLDSNTCSLVLYMLM